MQHALTDRKAHDLLDWMSDIKIPDEHFFQTLNHNPHILAPGAFSGIRPIAPFLFKYQYYRIYSKKAVSAVLLS